MLILIEIAAVASAGTVAPAPAFAASILSAAAAAAAFPPITGGWRAVDPDDAAVQAAAAFAAEQLGSEPSGVEGAERQAVAGTNFRFTLTLSDGRRFNVTVFRALNGAYSLTGSDEIQDDTNENESSAS